MTAEKQPFVDVEAAGFTHPKANEVVISARQPGKLHVLHSVSHFWETKTYGRSVCGQSTWWATGFTEGPHCDRCASV